MADKRIDIDIKTNADTGAAKAAAKDIQAVGDAAEKAAENFNPMVDGQRQYTEAVERAREQADDAAASIDNATASVENLNEASGEGSVKVLANDLQQASESSEKFSGNIEKVVERSNTKLGRSVRQFNNIKRSLDGVVGSSSKAVTALKSVGKAFGIGSIVTIFFKGLGFVQSGFEKLDAPVQRFNDNLRLTESGFQRIVGPIAAVTGGLRQFVTETNNWINPFKKWSDYKDAVNQAADSIRKSEKALDDFIAKSTKELAERQKSVLAANQRAVAEANIAKSLNEQADARERSEDAVSDAKKEASDNDKRLRQLAENAKKIAEAQAERRKAEIDASELPEARKVELKIDVDDALEGYALKIGNTISESSIKGLEGVISELDERIQTLNAQVQPAKSQLEKIAKPEEFANLLTKQDQAISLAQKLGLARLTLQKELAVTPDFEPEKRKRLEEELSLATEQQVEASKARIPLQKEFNAKISKSIRVLQGEGFLELGEEVTAEKYKAAYEAAGTNAKELANALNETKEDADEFRANLKQASRALVVEKEEQKIKETTKQLDRNTKEQNDAIKKQSESSKKAASEFASALQQLAGAGRGEIARPATDLGRETFKRSPEAQKAADELKKSRDKFISDAQISAYESVAKTIEDGIIDPQEADDLAGLLFSLKQTIDPANTKAIEAINDLITIAEGLSDDYDLIEGRIKKLESEEQQIKEGRDEEPRGAIEKRSPFEPQQRLEDVKGVRPIRPERQERQDAGADLKPLGDKAAELAENQALAISGVIELLEQGAPVESFENIATSVTGLNTAIADNNREVIALLNGVIVTIESNSIQIASLQKNLKGLSKTVSAMTT